jgi:hypothetical protein
VFISRRRLDDQRTRFDIDRNGWSDERNGRFRRNRGNDR